MLDRLLVSEGADHWYRVLNSAGVPAGPINNIAEAFDFAERLGLQPTVAVAGSATPQVANPITLSATPVTYRLAPPRLGGGAIDGG